MTNYTDDDSSLSSGQPIFIYHFFGETIGHWRFTNSTRPFTLFNNTGDEVGVFDPWPIKHGDVSLNMTPDKKDLVVSLAAGSSLDEIYTAFPPTENLNIVIRRTHNADTSWYINAPVVWTGHALGIEFNGMSEVEITCVPRSISSQRPGLRRNYQLNCPHMLYGPDCKVDKENFTVNRTVTALGSNFFEVDNPLSPALFSGGLVTWLNSSGQRETLGIRMIGSAINERIYYQGKVRNLPIGTVVQVSYGCNRTTNDCESVFNNILNYGGCDSIPLDNPSTRNSSMFY